MMITSSTPFINSIEEATNILSKWDAQFVGGSNDPSSSFDSNKLYENIHSINNDYLYTLLPDAVRYLNMVATKQYNEVTKGRVILGICANNAADGTQALKSWVHALQLPRGLLYGLGDDGVPVLDGGGGQGMLGKKNGTTNNNTQQGIYLKYNSLYAQKKNHKNKMLQLQSVAASHAIEQQQRHRQPGDVLASAYAGKYRGVYFQIELPGHHTPHTFRPYLLPANIF